jgi:hypothetical protein
MFRAEQTSLLQETTGTKEKRSTERADQKIDSTGSQIDAQVWN